MATRPASTSGGRTGRQLGTVFAATAVVGAVLGGTVSYLTASDSDAAQLDAGITATVTGVSPDSKASADAVPDVTASVDGLVPVTVAVLPSQSDSPAVQAGQPAATGSPATDDPAHGNPAPSPAPAPSTQKPEPQPTATTSPSATATPTAVATTKSPTATPSPTPQKG